MNVTGGRKVVSREKGAAEWWGMRVGSGGSYLMSSSTFKLERRLFRLTFLIELLTVGSGKEEHKYKLGSKN